MKGLVQYFYEIKPGKAILWCYFIWYLVIAYFYFDSSPNLWRNSLSISAVIGTGLLLSVSPQSRRDRWQTLRLYLMPFCVSSFAALTKDQGFIIVVSPKIQETIVAIVLCAMFLGAILLIKNRLNSIDR